jgi:Tol biopolymer transport system component
LTFEPGLQTDAAFSPDGRSFAYTSDRAGNFDIWVQSLDGGPARQLTHSLAPDTQPAWSPDGTRIVFRSERDQGGLYRVSLDGGPETQLTSFGVRPVWSADGAEVLFRTEIFPGAQTAIHAVSPEGGEAPRDLAQDFARSGNWSWLEPHPDGRVSGIGLHLKSGVGFYTASRDGKNVVASRLGKDGEWKDLAAAAWRFSWNANGTLLYVEAVFNQVRNVWRVRVDPVTLDWITAERLTTGSGQDVAAALAPAGGRMVFTQQQESRRLWVIPIDADAARVSGSGTAITPEDGRAEGVSLSPDGRRVAYTLLRAGRVRGELLVTELESNNTELFSTDAIAGGWSPDSRTLAYSLKRPDVVLPQEWALAVRQVGGPERIIGRWSKTEAFLPTDWTRDGASLLGSYQSPPFTGPAALALWPLSSPAPKQRTLIEAPGFSLWQGKLSPNGRWLAFVAQPLDEPNRLGMYVARERAPVSEWMQIASSHPWADKPRWAPNGRVLYFISKRGAPHFNLWGVRFDPDRGTPIGDSFALTRFDTPRLRISPDVGWTEIGISATRAVVTMETTRGNIWMMDNVDR